MMNSMKELIINVEKAELIQTGAALPHRFSIRYTDQQGRPQTGFFTESVDMGNGFQKLYLYTRSLCSNMDAIFDKLEEVLETGSSFGDPEYLKIETLSQLWNVIMPDDDAASIDDFETFLCGAGVSLQIIENAHLTEDNFYLFKTMLKTMVQATFFSKQPHFYSASRSVAMSNMAALLCMPDVIVQSRPMTLLRKDGAITGTFMEMAKGRSFQKTMKENPPDERQELKIDYDKIVKAAADLMVLDYICMSVDRHQDNIFYTLVPDSSGDPSSKALVLTDLQGIDNDFSFAAFVPKSDDPVGWLPPLSAILLMRNRTARRVLRLTEERVRSALQGNGLSEEEMGACWERVQRMQARIRAGKIRRIRGKAKEEDYLTMETHCVHIEDSDPVTPFYNIELLKTELKEVKHVKHNSKAFI